MLQVGMSSLSSRTAAAKSQKVGSPMINLYLFALVTICFSGGVTVTEAISLKDKFENLVARRVTSFIRPSRPINPAPQVLFKM